MVAYKQKISINQRLIEDNLAIGMLMVKKNFQTQYQGVNLRLTGDNLAIGV